MEITRETVKTAVLEDISWDYENVTEDTIVSVTDRANVSAGYKNGVLLTLDGCVCVREIVNYFYSVAVIQDVVSKKHKRDEIIYTHNHLYTFDLEIEEIECIFAKVCQDCLADLEVKPQPMSHYFHDNWLNLDVSGFCELVVETIEQIRKEKTAET